VNIYETLHLFCFRYLKSNYEITTEEIQKTAVVNVELTVLPSIKEMHMFVMDVSKLKNFTLTNGTLLN